MHQRCEVNEFDHAGNSDQVRRDIAAGPTTRKDQSGTNALSRRIDALIRHPANFRFERIELRVHEHIQRRHVRFQHGEYGGKILRADRGRLDAGSCSHEKSLKLGLLQEMANQ